AKNWATVFHFWRINKNGFLANSVKSIENSVSFSADKKESFSFDFSSGKLKIWHSVSANKK
ncbi:MAG: hypothetical protein AAF849_23540, partial [Bacteroidota bacterium]